MDAHGTVLFTVRHIPISEIVIGPRHRHKIDPGDIIELAEDIRKHGLLHPIVVSGNRLISGFRRCKACKLLGWETIPAHDLGEVSEDKALEIELMENLHHKPLTWAEEAAAYKRLVERRKEKKRSERVRAVARLLNVSTITASIKLRLADALEENPELARWREKEVLSALERGDDRDGWRDSARSAGARRRTR
jgi:ParB/RepB/Spo0J family partition protein